jgi:protein-L-isoaspartate(D-aspartate) O-methyltransferase
MLDLPREAFVPEPLKTLAYMDTAARISETGDRSMMAPRVLAKLLQLAELDANDVVLTVGAGSGYATAVIGRIVQTVVALESDVGLAASAGATLAALSADNVAVVTGPLAEGYPSEGPYDAIVIDGAIADAPPALLDQLKDGGRLVAVVEAGPIGKATIWKRLGSSFDSRVEFDAGAPRLPGFERRAVFAL